ncbi:MAG TPA: hypothetical protein VFG05_10580 [Methylocella sp.]|nr:hypothetical protein [Methylocella sp.]
MAAAGRRKAASNVAYGILSLRAVSLSAEGRPLGRIAAGEGTRHGRHRKVPAACLVESEKCSRGDPKIGAEKAKGFLLLSRRDPGEGAQIGQRLDNRREGKLFDIVLKGQACPLGPRRCCRIEKA